MNDQIVNPRDKMCFQRLSLAKQSAVIWTYDNYKFLEQVQRYKTPEKGRKVNHLGSKQWCKGCCGIVKLDGSVSPGIMRTSTLAAICVNITSSSWSARICAFSSGAYIACPGLVILEEWLYLELKRVAGHNDTNYSRSKFLLLSNMDQSYNLT